MNPHPTTAQGSLRVHTPAGYADRRRNDGARFVRPEGEPSWIAGTALVIACLLAVFGAVLVLHAVFAPAASAPSSLQAQAAHPSTGVEAAGNGEIS